MWLVRLRMCMARPWERGMKRFQVGPSLTTTSLTYHGVHINARELGSVGQGRTHHAVQNAGRLVGRELELIQSSLHRQTFDVLGDQTGSCGEKRAETWRLLSIP